MASPDIFAGDLRAEVDQHERAYPSFRRQYHRWNTLDLIAARRLSSLGIEVSLPKSVKSKLENPNGNRKGAGPEWVRVTDSQWVESFVQDVDSVIPGGSIRIYTGKADPKFYNHPLVKESLLRAAKPSEAFLAHSERGVGLVDLKRYQDAAYDFQYAESLADGLGLTVDTVREAGPKLRRRLQAPLGDMFGRFGYTLLALKLPGQARSRLERALAYHPRQEFVNANLGACLRVLGEPAALAAKYYQRELKINPNHPYAAEELATLKAS